MGLEAVALIGRNNSPVYLRRPDGKQADREIEYLVFAALDAVDEKLLDTSPAGRAPYLGLLTHIDGYAFFGYISNSLMKTIIVWQVNSPVTIDMANFSKDLYLTYVHYVCNPFCRNLEAFPVDENSNHWLTHDDAFIARIKQTTAKYIPDNSIESPAIHTEPPQEPPSTPPPPPSSAGDIEKLI